MLGSLSYVLLAAAASTAPCESLRSVSLAQTTIVTAGVVQAGVFVPPAPPAGARQGGPPAQPASPPQPIPQHCRVTMVLRPTSDSHINVELWMPTDNWNGKLLVVGNGGFAGSIQGYGHIH